MHKGTHTHGDAFEHHVQLFDSLETRAEAIADQVREAYDAGANVLIVIAADHWRSVADRLNASTVPLAAASDSGRITMRDAAAVLPQLMRRGRPDAAQFDAVVGAVVRGLAAGPRPLWIYGELVDLLALEGDFRGAQILEEFWNHLRLECPFTLFCGYGAVNFGDPRSTDALQSICRLHSHVRSNPSDLLGSFLVQTVGILPAPAE